MEIPETLVIVPCGSSKIWDKQPVRGPSRAADAYTGPPFKLNREYAELFGDAWVILSAKYGFVKPDFVISETYEVTFKRRKTGPVDVETLRRQVEDLQLHRFARVIGLGGAEYRNASSEAFASFDVSLTFPFAGLQIGRMMQAAKLAIRKGQPGFSNEVLIG